MSQISRGLQRMAIVHFIIIETQYDADHTFSLFLQSEWSFALNFSTKALDFSISILFGSPEHKVLMVSSFPSCVCLVRQQMLKQHLPSSVNSAGIVLHKVLPKLFKELSSMQSSGCHGNRKKKLFQTVRHTALLLIV